MTPRRYARLCAVLAQRQPDLQVALERVHKTHNLAAVLRTCDAVGVATAHAIGLDGPLPAHRDTAAGSNKWVEVRRWPDSRAALAHFRAEGLQVLAATLGDDAVDYRAVDYTRPTVVLLGAERDGLAPETAAAADRRILIPMHGMVASLNVSVAAAVILYEAERQRRAAGFYARNRWPADEFQRRLFEWAYPRLAARCRAEGRPYPPLDEAGRLQTETP